MTLASDFMTPHDAISAPARYVDGTRALLRSGRRLLGASLMLATVGLWVAPGASMATDLLLIKMVLSLVCGFAGLACLQSWSAPAVPEAEIDTIRRHVRLVRWENGKRIILQECSFAQLGHVERTQSSVTLWDAQGDLLAEVVPNDTGVLRALVSGLRDAGKL